MNKGDKEDGPARRPIHRRPKGEGGSPKEIGGFEKYREILEKQAIKECQACGGTLEIEKVNLEDYQGGKLYMLEGVPAYVCQECGELWVPEPIMEEFEKMIETAKRRKVKSSEIKIKRQKTK